MAAIILPLKVPLAPDTSPPVILPPAVILPPVVIDVTEESPPTIIPEAKEDVVVAAIILPATCMVPRKLAFPVDACIVATSVSSWPRVIFFIVKSLFALRVPLVPKADAKKPAPPLLIEAFIPPNPFNIESPPSIVTQSVPSTLGLMMTFPSVTAAFWIVRKLPTFKVSLICIFPAKEDSPSLLMLTFVAAPSLILKVLKQSKVSSQLTLDTSRKPANDALPVCVREMLLTPSASYIIKLCPWMKVFA